jgi:SPP1 gp7 family putative phage head morphogenesis protein
MKLGKPLKDPSARTVRDIRKLILQAIEDLLFTPIYTSLNSVKDNNFQDVISQAIANNKIFYDGGGGAITGVFNSDISRALKSYGAVYSSQNKAYVFDEFIADEKLIAAINRGDLLKTTRSQLAIKALNKLNLDALEDYDFPAGFKKVIDAVDKQITVGINPIVSSQINEAIAINYSNNLELTIRGFLDKEIISLRKIIEANAQAGNRASSVIDIIQDRFTVSKSKATFLAKQETRLLQAQYSDQRYQEVGVEEYIWSTSKDINVRPLHKKLDGTTQKFNYPPVIDERTGQRGSPGEAFGCRCVKIPILPD